MQGSSGRIGLALPTWQVALVLAGLPALYMINSLTPWAIGLLRRHDHAAFFPFWSSIAVLHWSSVALIAVLLRRHSATVRDLGLEFGRLRAALALGVPVLFGLGLILVRRPSSASQGSADPSAVVAPATMRECLFWIFMSLTAGFCEELVYRGFGIRALQGRGRPTWQAVGLSALAFVLMHGINVIAVVPFVIVLLAGLVFSGLFLWRRSLWPVICLHALFDMAAIRGSR